MQQQQSSNYHMYFQNSIEFHQQTQKIYNQKSLVKEEIKIQIPQVNQIHQSIHLQQYLQYFREVQQSTDRQIKTCLQNVNRRLQYKIVFLNQNSNLSSLISFQKPVVYLTGNEYDGSIAIYQVIITNYKLTIQLLNLNINAPNNVKQIGNGAYGTICLIPYYQKEILVSKRLFFNHYQKVSMNQRGQRWCIRPNPYQINQAICEYCIYKICSFYQIGPAIFPNMGFDLICFQDFIQFYMEVCYPISTKYDKLQQHIKFNTRLLHKLNMIHKDIKPTNMLYSPKYCKFVLIDFGISHPVKQNIGQLSKTYKQGTTGYMSKQMESIKFEGNQYVDLYYNDCYGIKRSMAEFSRYSKVQDVKTIKSIIFKNQVIPQQYSHIYFLSLCLTNIKQKITAFLMNLNQQGIEFKSQIIDSRFQKALEIVNDIIEQQQLDPYFFKINQNHKFRQQYIINLIRCNGLTRRLQFELDKVQASEDIKNIIQKLKSQISKEMPLPSFDLNIIAFYKFNQVEYLLKRFIRKLEDESQKYHRSVLFKYLVILFKLVIKKTAKFTRQIFAIQEKLNTYKTSINQILQYQICTLMVFVKFELNKIYCRQFMQKLLKKFPEQSIQILESVIQITTDKSMKFQCEQLCLNEYVRQRNKKKILQKVNTIVNRLYFEGRSEVGMEIINDLKVNKGLDKNINQLKYNMSQEELLYLAISQKISLNYEEAAKYYGLVIQKQQQEHGEKSLKIALFSYEIGLCYMKSNHMGLAENSFLKAIKLFQFFVENYLHDNFYELCLLQLIKIYALNCKSQKIKTLITILFYKQRKYDTNKSKLQCWKYDQVNQLYIYRSPEILMIERLKLNLKEKANKVVQKLITDEIQQTVEALLIFKEEWQILLMKQNYLSKLNLTFCQSDLNEVKQYLIEYKRTAIICYIQIIQKYIQTQIIRNAILNQLVSNLAYRIVMLQEGYIDKALFIKLFHYLWEQQDFCSKQSIFCIIYLTQQFSLLDRIYSAQFINCAYRLSILHQKRNCKQICLYYTMQILIVIQHNECEQKKKINQLYRRISECINQRKIKKKELFKIKELKSSYKKNFKVIELAKFYNKMKQISYFVILMCYIKYFLKKDSHNQLYNFITKKIDQQEKICKKIFEPINQVDSDCEALQLLKYFKVYQFLLKKVKIFKQTKKFLSNKEVQKKLTKLLN